MTVLDSNVDKLVLPSEVEDNTVAFDVETSGLHPDDGARICAASIAWYDVESGFLESLAIPFDMGGNTPSLFGVVNYGIEMWYHLLDWLGDKQLVMHNGKFDCLHTLYGVSDWGGSDIVNNLWWDTMIAAWVINPLGPKALKVLGEEILDEKPDEQDLVQKFLKAKKSKRFDLVPWDILGPYADQDALLTYRLYEHQRATELHGFDEEFNLEMAITRLLTRMEIRGIRYDSDASSSHARKIRREMAKQRFPFKATGPAARSWFFSEETKAIPHCLTSTGAPSLSECCINQLIEQGVPYAGEWRDYSIGKGFATRYYDGYPKLAGDDGRLRSFFGQTNVETYRFSSSRVNLQSLPHDYKMGVWQETIPSPRSLFIPEDDHVLLEMDLAQAELRLGARYVKCEPMLDIIREGRDPHGETAAMLFNTDTEANDWFQYRQIAKRCNFALQYGVGPDTMKMQIEKFAGVVLTRSDVYDIIEGWHKLYPEYRPFMRKAERLARQRGYIKLVDGKHRLFAKNDDHHKAYNALIQGSIAQLMKHAMVLWETRIPDTLLIQVHDSIVAEVDESLLDLVDTTIAEWQAQCTEMARVPMQVDTKIWNDKE